MRIMVAIPHYYAATADSSHASTDGRIEESRRAAVRAVFTAWRHLFAGDQALLNIERRTYERIPSRVAQLGLVAVTTRGRHLLDPEFCRSCSISHIEVELDDPRMLGFHAHKLFAEHARRFDLFVFSEDDLLPRDPGLLDKQLWFTETFGQSRVLLPNRYEWNLDGPAAKTFIDGDLVARLTDPWFAALPDERFLTTRVLGQRLTFERSRNPHSGFFALTQEQLRHWMGLPHWGDKDASFISPLESAATLGVLKSFAVYKSCGTGMDFCEVEHADTRFSALARR